MAFNNNASKDNYVHMYGSGKKERLMVKLFKKEGMFVIQASDLFTKESGLKNRNLKFIFKDISILKEAMENKINIFELLNSKEARKSERVTTKDSVTKTNILDSVSEENLLFWLKNKNIFDLVSESELELLHDFIN